MRIFGPFSVFITVPSEKPGFCFKNLFCRQIYQLENVDDRIPILQVDPEARTKTKARCEERKMVLNQELGGRLTTLKIVEMF